MFSSFADSPFAGGTYEYFYLEDFEDGALNTPGVSANGGNAYGVPGEEYRDSVDWDGDHIIDGLGNAGGNYYAYPNHQS